MTEVVRKYAYIDALRGIAILGVLLIHNAQYGNSNNYHPLFMVFIQQGARGVQLFYMLSALTLFLSMESRKGTEKYPIINFFIRRFFRIAPLFYLSVIYYLGQDGFGSRYWLGDAPNITIYNLLATLTFTNGLNPYWINSIVPVGWSVAIEMNFYLLLPFLFKKIKNIQTALWVTLVMLLGSQVIVYWLSKNILITDHRLWQDYLFLFFPTQSPVFLLGIVLFYLVDKKEVHFREDNVVKIFDYPIFLLFFGIVLLAHFATGIILPSHFLSSIALAIIIYSLYLNPCKALVNSFTTFIGRLSFSIYLTHFGVLHIMKKLSIVDFVELSIFNFIIRYFVLLCLCTIMSSITYKLVEKPGQNLGKKLISMIENKQKLKFP